LVAVAPLFLMLLTPVSLSAQQTALLDDFSTMRTNACPGCSAPCPSCLWQVVSDDQTQSISNGTYQVKGGPSDGIYFRFQPRSESGYSYPANYAQAFLKSGTWNPDYNHLSIQMKCDVSLARYDNYGHWLEWGTYIRAHDDTDGGNQGQHYYHQFNPSIYANKWITLDIDRHPQWRVGGTVGTEYWDDPEWTAPTQSSPVHYFDGITHHYPIDDEMDQRLNGHVCNFDNATFRYVPNEPDAFVSSVTTTYTGSAYELTWSTPKNLLTTYQVRYSTSPMRTNGWSSGTDGGTTTTATDTAWAYWSLPHAETTPFYVAIRPQMNITAATGGTPVKVTTYLDHNLATGDQVTVAGVCAGVNGTQTVTVVDRVTLSLNGTSGTCSYSSGGTVTATSNTTNFSEYAVANSATGATTGSTSTKSCDLNSDAAVNVVDVQLAVQAALGQTSCTMDLNSDGKCDIVDIQRVVNAALGATCVIN
jgi:hypothetical protein